MAKNEIMEPIVAENGIQTIVGNGLFLIIDQQGGCYNEGVVKNGIMEPPMGENGMRRQLLERVSFVSSAGWVLQRR